jgi:hypothetical protein
VPGGCRSATRTDPGLPLAPSIRRPFRGTVLTPWFIAAGVVAMVMTYAAGQLRRAPLSAGMVYLGIGLLLGPHGIAAWVREIRDPAQCGAKVRRLR